METSDFNVADSLRTIETAFNETRNTKSGAHFYYILWGTVLFLYFIIHFIVLKNSGLKGSFLDIFSWVLFPIGGVLSMFKRERNKKVLCLFLREFTSGHLQLLHACMEY